MGRIRYSSDVAVPVDVAFAYVDNYANVPDWLFGVSRFAPVGEQDRGLGADLRDHGPTRLWRYTFRNEVTAHRQGCGDQLDGPYRPFGNSTPSASDPLGCGRSILDAVEIDYHSPPVGPIGYLAGQNRHLIR